MKLYSGPLSFFSRKIEIALAEKGLAFDRICAPFTHIEGYAPKLIEVTTANPKGQVPVLNDGSVTLYDSTVILEYLEDAYPEPPLYPGDPAARARCRVLELYADEIMLPPLKALMHRSEPWNDPERRKKLEVRAGRAEAVLAQQFVYLEGQIRGNSFLGEGFSAADIAVFMGVHFGQRLGGPALARTRRLFDWYAELSGRPAFTRVIDDMAEADGQLSRPVAGAFKDAD